MKQYYSEIARFEIGKCEQGPKLSGLGKLVSLVVVTLVWAQRIYTMTSSGGGCGGSAGSHLQRDTALVAPQTDRRAADLRATRWRTLRYHRFKILQTPISYNTLPQCSLAGAAHLTPYDTATNRYKKSITGLNRCRVQKRREYDAILLHAAPW